MKSENINKKLLVLITAFIMIMQGYSTAQETKNSLPVTIGEHKFIVNSRIGSPFVNTTYTNFMGVGQTLNIKYPDIKLLNQKIAEIRGDLIYTKLSFEYQQEIRDWMAFQGKFDLYGKLGTETGVLISQGVNLNTGYELSWKFKLFQTRKLAMSTSLFLSRQSFTSIDLMDFIKNILDSLKLTRDNKLVKTVPLLRGGFGFNGAYAVNKTFGISAGFGIDYGESFQRNDADVWNYSYGIGFDADLYPVQKVPIGFLAGFRHTYTPDSKEVTFKRPNSFIFQINYTGNETLNLGMEIYYQWYRPQNFDEDIKTVFMSLLSSIYF